jgi:4-hydroxy-tetrahydrodipicolinate reductase
MTIKVIINGALGRMGQHCVRAIDADADLELVAQATHVTDLAQTIKQTGADVVVDFTSADDAFANTQCIIENNARPVIGSSGLTQKTVDQLTTQCREKKLGGVVAPNFSIGAVLMMTLSQQAAKYFNDVEIIETHHTQKKDAPSGTATRTAEMIAGANPALKTTRDNQQGDQSLGVPIHSIRMPGIYARQHVLFGAPGETLSIEHDCSNPQAYMPGVLIACKKVMTLDHMVYGLEALL